MTPLSILIQILFRLEYGWIVFQKWSLVALLLDWGQIPAKVIFLTIIQNYIQKIRSLYRGIRAQWAIEKHQTYKNIGANRYELICNIVFGF